LIRSVFDKHRYVSLEDPDERHYAQEDPRGFLDQFTQPVILDEVQNTPDLFSYLQSRVDLAAEDGQFVLSGSQNFLLLRQVSQSLAGRASIAHLLPFTLSELHGRPVRADDTINANLPRTKPFTGSWTDIAFSGFYPRIHDRHLPPGEWLAQYFQTYLQRDVRTLAQVGDLEAFRRFVLLCAGRAGQLLNLSALGNDAGISHETARRWLSMLETSFIVFRLQPHHQNFRKRLIKSPKLYFVDTGLLCYLLRIEDPEQLQSHAMRGAVFENLVIGELHKSTFHAGREPGLSFWRDNKGNEIDLIVSSGSSITPIEIKSGATIASDYFKGLEYWNKLSGGDGGVLVYGGDSSSKRFGFAVRSWRQWP
jgi:predicted AAA+ superfamily ATPase